MKKIAITAVAAIFALGACSAPAATSPSEAPTITPIPSVRASTAATPAPAATAAASAAATSATTVAPAGNATPRKVDITATNSDYSIKTLTVKAGEKIEFVVKNTGEEKHNLVGVGEGISLVSPDLEFGQTTSWIWTAPTKLGTFKFQCSYHTNIPPIQVTVQ